MVEPGRQRKQISCYVTEEWHQRARAAADRRGERHISEWFRGLVMNAVLETEADDALVSGAEDLAPDVELAAARKTIEGMEGLIASQRERIGDYQAHMVDLRNENDKLHALLVQEQTNVERITLMLPAAGETGKRRRWWNAIWGGSAG